MKKFFVLLQCVSIAFACVGCGESAKQSNTGFLGETFHISYKVEERVPVLMWKPNGNYPKSYAKGTEVRLDGLRHCRKDENTIYAFEGWYYDENYTHIVTDGILSNTQNGDLNLYAKIVERTKAEGDEVVASITYKWNDFGTFKEGIESFPKEMIQGITLPTEYIEGIGVTLPDLHSTTYEFDGWCYDISCKNQVKDNIISTDTVGNITLYAALSIWID